MLCNTPDTAWGGCGQKTIGGEGEGRGGRGGTGGMGHIQSSGVNEHMAITIIPFHNVISFDDILRDDGGIHNYTKPIPQWPVATRGTHTSQWCSSTTSIYSATDL